MKSISGNYELNTQYSLANNIIYCTKGIIKQLSKQKPDLFVVLGDRYELLSGITAVLGEDIPIVHIHGGSITEGAIDDMIRHAVTKLIHTHFVGNLKAKNRVLKTIIAP